jgi:hypothetical protein
MNRSGLKIFAAILALAIVGVLFAGLDDLPRSVRAQIGSERAALVSARDQVAKARLEVDRQIQADPALFENLPAKAEWPGQFDAAGALLASASGTMDRLSALEKANRREDRAQVETLLSQERNLRNRAAAQAGGPQKEAARYEDLKQRLPQTLAEMEQNRRALRDFDLAPVAAAVTKAQTDWPARKAELDARLAAQRDLAAEGDRLWDATADERRKAAAGGVAHLDFGTLIGAADKLKTNAAELPTKSAELKAAAAQLYTAWDKVLVDMQTRGRGSSKTYEQKIRTVKTTFSDAATKSGDTSSAEDWQAVPQPTYEAMRNNLGMAVAHKPEGKFDWEAERVPQPAGFAYMAPPGQSNQYGRWERRNGSDFWVFYGQYALMRDLLFNRNYRPLERGDWDGYRSSQNSGQTYYGGDSGGQRYGTNGSTTQKSYSGSTFAQGGGFRDSKYANKSGSYRSSPYASPSARDPGSSAPRTFGKTPSSPAPRTFRPSPAPRSFSMPRSAPRRFGRH